MRTSTLAALTALLVFVVGLLAAVGLWTTAELDPPARHLSALAMGVLMTTLAGRVLVVGHSSHALLLSEDRLGHDTRVDAGINTGEGGRELFHVRLPHRPDASHHFRSLPGDRPSTSPIPDGMPTPDDDEGP